MKKRITEYLSIVAIVFSFISISPASGATPFVTDYPFGIQMADDPTLLTKYNSWVSWFVTSAGANGYRRVKYPEGLACGGADAVSSQGIGYAMLLASWFGDQTLFNDLWNYKCTVSPKLGLMASCVDSGGFVIDQNSSTDADADIAMALVHAHRRWGSGGTLNYSSLATTEINKVAANDICPSSYNLYPGDYCSCASNDNTYPSYFTPAWYPIFGAHTGNISFWDGVKTKAYSMLASSRAANGLDAEQITYGGTAVGGMDGYNSARIPWRYSLDYVWHGTTNSLAQITLDSGFFTGKSGSACAVYNVNGTCADAAYAGHRIGPAGTSMMITGKDSELASYYNASAASLTPSNYYDATMALLAMLQITGNCPNEYGSVLTCVCVTMGDLFDDCEDGDDQNNWGGFWYTYYDRGPLNYGTSYVVPNPVSWYTSAGMAPTPFYMQQVSGPVMGGSSAARMTGYVTTVFTYGFFGMGSGTNRDSGRMTFTPVDCSMYTGIRFKAKAPNNYIYDFKIICPKSVTNTGDNDYKFTFTPVTYTTLITVPFSLFTQAVGWGIPVSLSTVIRNLTDIQWQTNGQPKTNVDLWVDDVEFYPAKPPTATPTYCPGQMFDTLDDNNEFNEFGGFWYTYQGASSTVYPVISTFTASAPGRGGVFLAAKMTGIIADFAGEHAGMGSSLNAAGTGRNMLAFVGISFWAKGGDTNYYSLKLRAGPSINTGGNEFKYTFKPALGTWLQYTVPFSLFTQESGWGIYVNLLNVLSNLKEIQFESKGINHTVDLWVDDIVFNCSQNWTPTRTPNRTGTFTPEPSFTITEAMTETSAFSATQTNTFAIVASYTGTPTRQETPEPTLTETTQIFSFTPYATPAETALPSATLTPSVTAVLTPVETAAKLVVHEFRTCPNPSTGNNIKFIYSHDGFIKNVKIGVFTFNGRKIAQIHDADKPPGLSATLWNMGHRLGNGMYYYSLELTGSGGDVVKKIDTLIMLVP